MSGPDEFDDPTRDETLSLGKHGAADASGRFALQRLLGGGPHGEGWLQGRDVMPRPGYDWLMRRLIGVIMFAGCSSTTAVDAIVNDDDVGSSTSYWLSEQPCLVPYGQGFCSNYFAFQITADGQARYTIGGGGATCPETESGTWDTIGDTSLGLLGVCPPGAFTTTLTLTDVRGAKSDGFFTADVSGYNDNRFNLQLGPIR